MTRPWSSSILSGFLISSGNNDVFTQDVPVEVGLYRYHRRIDDAVMRLSCTPIVLQRFFLNRAGDRGGLGLDAQGRRDGAGERPVAPVLGLLHGALYAVHDRLCRSEERRGGKGGRS